ncbi:uncharacterized protein FOMMEDRAFT_158955 [Fomitiporia mediterranea MF3/22]|uniref:uncharacterized protein n=1 Tax=Fomitiporia mediterranea (strain MF3/22) TaxID=694068 RepID=UPI0004408789|nr:uncharacterized protein FOMMEDRAFT_158955 [Fomitiporia mediterranea MF3/22]EJD00286.1 hypothetical protein FOMMEDRAFT_158955 [Fomitiporia mediterranea MF3/22]
MTARQTVTVRTPDTHSPPKRTSSSQHFEQQQRLPRSSSSSGSISPRNCTRRTTSSKPSPTSTPKPKRRKQKSLEHLPILQPAFILTPLNPGAMPMSPTSSAAAGNVPEDDRPRRAASSPQLLRTRARSDSASSSASLTATEDNYARARTTHASASTSRFPAALHPTTAYPPLWTLAQPLSSSSRMGSSSTSSSNSSAEGEDEEEEEEHGDEDGTEDLIFFSRAASSSSSGLRNRNRERGGGQRKESEVPRVVTTARGQPCAGETETEVDEFVRCSSFIRCVCMYADTNKHFDPTSSFRASFVASYFVIRVQPQRLPTSRNVTSRPVVPLLIDFLVPFLFQVTRFLSVIPATFGTLYNLYHVVYPPSPPSSGGVAVGLSGIDFVICALWAILTGTQCLLLTTGLLVRWKAYYTTPSTLIRLVALQCICWPATHFTLVLFDHTKRPVACWALIGTTTCLSRSVQIWVTSNLFITGRAPDGHGHHHHVNGHANGNGIGINGYGKVQRLREGRVGPRRWDWGEMLTKCALPAGVLYFVTAWGLIFKDELLRMQMRG